MTDTPQVRLVPFVKAKRAQTKDDYESWKDGVTSPTLNGFDNSGDSRATVATIEETNGQLAVRRLTPRECERLQGWDDDWTRWDDTGKEQADTVRYRQIGNGVASPVAEWLGRCIILFEQKMDDKDADTAVR